MREQLIDEYDVDFAILLPRAMLNNLPDPDMASAVAAAYNDWLADTWLDKYNHDGKFKGSLYIATQDPIGACQRTDLNPNTYFHSIPYGRLDEKHKRSQYPDFVQVMTDSGARAPFGQRQYYPIYEACEKRVPAGYPSRYRRNGHQSSADPGSSQRYIEFHTCLSLAFQAHLVSFLTEGVFVKFPNLNTPTDLPPTWTIFRCLVKSYDVAVEPLEESLETYPVAIEEGLVVLYA